MAWWRPSARARGAWSMWRVHIGSSPIPAVRVGVGAGGGRTRCPGTAWKVRSPARLLDAGVGVVSRSGAVADGGQESVVVVGEQDEVVSLFGAVLVDGGQLDRSVVVVHVSGDAVLLVLDAVGGFGEKVEGEFNAGPLLFSVSRGEWCAGQRWGAVNQVVGGQPRRADVGRSRVFGPRAAAKLDRAEKVTGLRSSASVWVDRSGPGRLGCDPADG